MIYCSSQQRYANSGGTFSLNSSGLGRFLEGDQTREQLNHVDATRRDSTQLDATRRDSTARNFVATVFSRREKSKGRDSVRLTSDETVPRIWRVGRNKR